MVSLKKNIINIFSNFYPILSLFDKCNDDYVYNEIKNNNFTIDFNNKITFEDLDLMIKIKNLISAMDNLSGNKIKKTVLSIIIIKTIIDNNNFLMKNEKFRITVFNKLIEFKEDEYETFEKIKEITNNINPIDICLELYNKIIKSNYSLEKYIIKSYDILLDLNEISNTHSILLDNNDSKFNFKVTNEYDIEKFNHVIYTLIKTSKNSEITMLALYEIFINNIKLVLSNIELKNLITNQIKLNLTFKLSNFEKYKKYNNNINPLITISRLLQFYFDS
jgi:hypothetical protein